MKRILLIIKGLSFFLITIMLVGCVTVEEREPTAGLTKFKIQQGWKRNPNRVYDKSSNKLKYGADEMWRYDYPSGDESRYYFKNNVLIKEEHVSYATF